MQRSRTLSDLRVSSASPGPATKARRGGGGLRRQGQKWARLLHVYASMIALAVVLFFSATGLTLNHPDWTFGIDSRAETVSGALPDDAMNADGTIEFLVVSDYLRETYGVEGEVTDYGIVGTEAYITYRGPGYSGDAVIDTTNGTFDLNIEQQGLLAVLNDLHKGRDTASSWNWLIDFSAVFLITISLTGLALQLFLTKRRKLAMTVAGAGLVVMLGMLLLAVS